jgi:hypothetical protein
MWNIIAAKSLPANYHSLRRCHGSSFKAEPTATLATSWQLPIARLTSQTLHCQAGLRANLRDQRIPFDFGQ